MCWQEETEAFIRLPGVLPQAGLDLKTEKSLPDRGSSVAFHA